MERSTCETIRLGFDSPRSGVNVQVVSNSQCLKATCAATAATCYRALCHKLANGKMKADSCVMEVWHVER